jgi:hypothetical protein
MPRLSRDARGLMAAALLAGVLAGCGSSSKQTTTTGASPTTGVSSPTSTSTTVSSPSATGPAVDKSTYQSKAVAVLRPMLQAINVAVHSPSKPAAWQQLQHKALDAYQTIGKLSPPPGAAGLQNQLVHSLSSVASTAGGLFSALSTNNLSAARPYGARLVREGHQITSLGNQFKSHGYKELGAILAGP